jgi:hypothetical protein
MMKRLILTLTLIALATTAFADVRLSRKFGVGLWRTNNGKFAILKMGNEKWYLYDQNCIMKNGNCFYKFYIPSMKMYMTMGESFLNVNMMDYSKTFE